MPRSQGCAGAASQNATTTTSQRQRVHQISARSILEHTAADGKTYSAKYNNLDAIVAVGYRVNSFPATQFRIRATKTLREFITKGLIPDDERLKQGAKVFGRDYFAELLERLREIRTSTRRCGA